MVFFFFESNGILKANMCCEKFTLVQKFIKHRHQLKLATASFYQVFIFHQIIALQKL